MSLIKPLFLATSLAFSITVATLILGGNLLICASNSSTLKNDDLLLISTPLLLILLLEFEKCILLSILPLTAKLSFCFPKFSTSSKHLLTEFAISFNVFVDTKFSAASFAPFLVNFPTKFLKPFFAFSKASGIFFIPFTILSPISLNGIFFTAFIPSPIKGIGKAIVN